MRTRHEAVSRYVGLQLLRGDVLLANSNHHAGMRWLKGLFGDPCPGPEYVLSLIVLDGPGVYWGYPSARDAQHRTPAVLLSRFPDDYAWETRAQNEARKKEAAYWKLEKAVCR